MKRSRLSIDASSVAALWAGPIPFRMPRETSEQVVLDLIAPQLRQLVDLSNNAVSQLAGSAETLGPKHAKFLAMYLGICLRMCFDCLTFGDKGMLSLAPLSRTQVVPASACVHSVIVMAVGSSANVVNVDRCVATFVVPAFGRPYVVSKAYHVMGNLFAIPVPVLPALVAGNPVEAEVQLTCGSEWSSSARIELCVAPVPAIVRKPYTPSHLPLHYAALSGDVATALKQLDKMSSDRVRALDEWGTEAASLALFHGHRVLYTLLMWRSLNWPALAVCQLVRARMELESNLIDGKMFVSVRESVHEYVQHATSDFSYRPIKYQTPTFSQSYRGPLAIMLLPEIPYTEHEGATPSRTPTGAHRRGSLDVLLQAIEVLSDVVF